MVSNQKEFDNIYNNKERKDPIKIEDELDFEGQLVIEGYSNLKELILKEIDKVEKITLKKLTRLQECTIWSCGTKELVIEDCPQIKTLNVRSNSLTSLEFIKDLRKLKELELDGNPKLSEVLKFYKGSWETYKKNIQELIRLAQENPQKLLEAQEKSEELKAKYDTLKKALASFSKEIQEQIKGKEIDEINSKIKDAVLPSNIVTKDLLDLFQSNVEKLKEWREEEKRKLSELRNKNQKLEEGLIKEKEVQLERLQKEFIDKGVSFGKKKEKLQDDLGIYLDSNNSLLAREKSRERLSKSKAKWPPSKEKETFELNELLKELWGRKISLLKAKGEIIKEITDEPREKYRRIEEESLQREVVRIKKLINSGEGSEPDSKLLKELKNELGSLQTKVIIKKTENYLGAKENYLNLRLEIAKGLQKCCDELNKHNNIEVPKKKAIIDGINNILGVVAIPAEAVNVNINKLVEAFSAVADYRGVIFTEEREKEFQKYLENNEDIINSFKENYGLLKKVLEENKNLPISSCIIKDLKLEDTEGSTKPLKAFETRYEEVCGISENWKEKYLKLEKMEEKVKSVVENLSNLNTELNTEKNRLEDIIKERQFQSYQEVLSK